MGQISNSSDLSQGAVPPPEPRPIYLRAYVPPAISKPHEPRRRAPTPSPWVLVFDTETWPDLGQNLRFGTYQLREGDQLRQKGMFYNPDEVTETELDELRRGARRHGCRLITDTQFREDLLFSAAYEPDATIVGFNLPFDISRIAIKHDSARAVRNRKTGEVDRSMAGGFTFKLWKSGARPRLRVKHLSRRSSFINFTQPAEQADFVMGDEGLEEAVKRPGHFLDLRTLAAALTSTSFDLDGLAEHLGVARKHGFKDFGRPIDAELISYAVQDAEVTWQCYKALIARYAQHELRTPPTRIYSEAGLGKAYLNAMNVRTWRTVQPDFPTEIVGAIMSSYFGGRAEVRRRREIVPALYCDFASMYPTVCTLMGLWRYVIADGVEYADWTDEAHSFLKTVDLATLKDRETWGHLPVLVQVQPDADIFPVRARYGKEPTTTIGLNYLSADRPLWFTMADCIASKLLTGKAPKVVRAMRFTPRQIQWDLDAINIAGNPNYRVEPSNGDFYKRVIDLRREVKSKLKTAKKAQASKAEIDRLDAEQLALKILANATSYGIFIELNVEDAEDGREALTVYGADGAFSASVRQRENPGTHFHPLLGTLITGAARLMLAITERLLTDEGLEWAFCDTDSMTFARPEGMSQAEFRTRVERVCAWFEGLNPYEKPGSILEFEDQNNDPDTGQPRSLFCYAVSAKRYALFNWDADNRPLIRKASAHGLGHLVPPYRDEDPDAPPRDSGVHLWQEHLWQDIILASLRGEDDDEGMTWAEVLHKPAASRYAATTPTILRWFNSYNKTRPYAEQLRPFGFLLWFHARKPQEVAQLDEFALFDPRQRRPKPVASYQRDLAKVAELWDRETGEPVGPEWLRTYAEELRQYPVHAESKFLNGGRADRGRTERRHVRVDKVWNIGKEADRFEEDSSLGAEDDPAIPYGMSAVDRAAALFEIRAGKSRHTVRAICRAARVSDHTLARAIAADTDIPDRDLVAILGAIRTLEADHAKNADATNRDLDWLRRRAAELGPSRLAEVVGEDVSNLLKMLSGVRRLSRRVRDAIAAKRREQERLG